LQVVSQALEKHIPVLLACKIESVLDSHSELFRRDSFLSLVLAIASLALGLSYLLRGTSAGILFIVGGTGEVGLASFALVERATLLGVCCQ